MLGRTYNEGDDLTNVFCRRKRSVPDPEAEPSLVHGGERAFLYEVRNGSFFFTNPTIVANTGQLSRAANIKYRKLSIERVLCFFYHSDDVFFGKKFIEIKLQGRLGDTSRDKLFFVFLVR